MAKMGVKRDGLTYVVTSDLRALLFWASVGVSANSDGAYGDTIENVIESYAIDHLKMQIRKKDRTFRRAG